MRSWEKQTHMLRAFPIAMLGALLVSTPAASAQHSGRSAGFSGGHFGGGHFAGSAGGGLRAGFSAPPSFAGFRGPAPRSLGLAPRSFGPAPRVTALPPHYNVAPRYGFVPQRQAFAGYRPAYGAGDRRGDRRGDDHRDHHRRQYFGYGFGYPYTYANSWELLPWDLGYPDFTGYGDESSASSESNAQVQPPDEEQQQPPPEEGPDRPDYMPYRGQPPATRPVAATLPQDEPELTLIFKDGRTQTIRNYLLTPREIIVMDDAASGRTPRIALSELNRPATQQAAQKKGLDFSPPSS